MITSEQAKKLVGNEFVAKKSIKDAITKGKEYKFTSCDGHVIYLTGDNRMAHCFALEAIEDLFFIPKLTPETNKPFGNPEQPPQFPDLIKAGLKVGDAIHSYLYGEGVVVNIDTPQSHPIVVRFEFNTESFTPKGFYHSICRIPSIHLQPWNPVSGEPFPFPKWEPIVGEVYAFWDDERDSIFAVSILKSKGEGFFLDDRGVSWPNCAPISEALRIFGFDKTGE